MNKVALQLDGFALHWYGVLVALGFLAGLWTASRRGTRDGLTADGIVDLGPWLIIGAIIGARALYVLSYWREHFAGGPWWEVFMVHHGGLVFYGGLIGAAVGGVVYCRIKRQPLWKLADALAPSIPLGHAFGRIGCLMNGCCYGRACDLPWAIHFPAGHESHPAGVHPTQVYEAILALGLYAALAWAYRRKRFDGQIFAAYLVAYSLLRSFVEVFRGDYSTYYLGGSVTPAQFVSGGIFYAGVLLLCSLPRRKKNQPGG